MPWKLSRQRFRCHYCNRAVSWRKFCFAIEDHVLVSCHRLCFMEHYIARGRGNELIGRARVTSDQGDRRWLLWIGKPMPDFAGLQFYHESSDDEPIM
jgi:hypothetical protein